MIPSKNLQSQHVSAVVHSLRVLDRDSWVLGREFICHKVQLASVRSVWAQVVSSSPAPGATRVQREDASLKTFHWNFHSIPIFDQRFWSGTFIVTKGSLSYRELASKLVAGGPGMFILKYSKLFFSPLLKLFRSFCDFGGCYLTLYTSLRFTCEFLYSLFLVDALPCVLGKGPPFPSVPPRWIRS